MTYAPLLLFAGVLVSLLVVGLAVGGALSRNRRRRARRIAEVAARARRGDAARRQATASLDVRRTVEQGAFPRFDAFLGKVLPRQSVLRARLARTGRPISIGAYGLACGGVMLVVGGAAVGILGFSPLVGLLAGVAFGLGLPNWIVGRMAARRMERFNAIFPDAIDLIVRGLRSGLPVTESIGAVGREMADPVGVEFRAVFDAMKFGRSLDDALWDTARRLDTPEFKFFVISLSVQRETGGNLAETLANLSDILRRRRQMRLKIKAMSSEARASAYILGSLPFLMFGIISALNWDYERALFVDPRGLIMIGFGLTSLVIGIAVMARMVRFEI